MDNLEHIFNQLKTYELVKLEQCYEKDSTSVIQIKKLKQKVNKMENRVNLIYWANNFVYKNLLK